MTRRLVVIGAGGFGREVLDVIEAINDAGSAEHLDVIGVLDDGDPATELLEPYGVAHLGPVSTLAELDAEVQYVIAVGHPASRRAIDEVAIRTGRDSPVLVHPAAWIGHRSVELGAGTVVCAHAAITNHVRLGRHVHLNLSTAIGHDAVVGNYVTLSPFVVISGGVVVEPEVFFGSGVSVNPGVRVGIGSVVGAGAAVIKDVEPGRTVVGVPARAVSP